MGPRVPTSRVLEDLLGEVSVERASLGWLFGRLGERSFGIILLLLAFIGLLPGVSAVAGVLLTILAFQMIMARRGPVFPRRIIDRDFQTRKLARVVGWAVPRLRYLEQFIYPRWLTPFEATKRAVGGTVLLLGVTLLIPVPLSNVPPAILTSVIAFAYLEQDGLLLLLALIAAVIVLGIGAAAIWQLLSTTGWVPGLL
jgi:hypothetical protein